MTTDKSEWAVFLVVGETGEHHLEWRFPTESGKSGRHRVSFRLKDKTTSLTDELLQFGAKFPDGDPKGFLSGIIDQQATPLTQKLLTSRTGYYDGGYILPHGAAVGPVPEVIWDVDAATVTQVGLTQGSLEGWNKTIGKACAESHPLAFAVMVMLGSALLRHARLPEAAVFNFAGESSTGKTTLAKVAASVVGRPWPLPTWNSSPRALEELAAAHCDVGLILNDTEAFPDDARRLRQTLKTVGQIIPDGQSKARSNIVSGRGKQLPSLEWRCFCLSTSIRTANDLATSGGSERSEGEQVRLIDIPIAPRCAGGIFDTLVSIEGQTGAESRSRIAAIEGALTEEYGTLLRPWVELLLTNGERLSERVPLYIERFVRRTAPHGSGLEARLAKKFALPYLAGKTAQKAGLIDWPEDLPLRAAQACYRSALGLIRSEAQRADAVFRHIVESARDEARIPVVRGKAAFSALEWNSILGFRMNQKGSDFIALHDSAVASMCGDPATKRAVLTRLKEAHVLLKGHGGKPTRQLPVHVGKKLSRRRMLCLNAAAMVALGDRATTGGPESDTPST